MRCLWSLVLCLLAGSAPAQPKPAVAVFPLGGDASAELRDRCAFSLRAKLERTEKYEVIDGPRMQEIAAEAEAPLGFSSPAEAICRLGKLVDATVLIWGEVVDEPAGSRMRLKILDLRSADPTPAEFSRLIRQPTDLRFICEEILQTLKDVPPFEQAGQTPVQNDPLAEQLWAKNPNLVKNGDFSEPGAWEGIYQGERYPVPVRDRLPSQDKVQIYRMAEKGQKPQSVLAMNLSRYCAENNGLACLSDPIPIEPDLRYRLSFRYRSDGPRLHVFVKGYALAESITGQTVEREVYRRQVPPAGKTDGKWVTVVDELNPQHVAFPVTRLRIDLYAYLQPGIVMFDDVVLKAVGPRTRQARDEALDRPVTRPSGPD